MGWSALISVGIGIDLDELSEPDRGPVYVRHKAEAEIALGAASDQMRHIHETFQRCPDVDDGINMLVGQLEGIMQAATVALNRFRNTRDCKGAA